MNDFDLLEKIIKNNSSFLITTHVNPDADAIGSELAMYFILEKLGKKVRIVNHSFTPYNLEFLDERKIIERYDENLHYSIFNETDILLILDLNQANRVVRMEQEIRNFTGTKICIDHHQDSQNFFDHFIGGVGYSATGEIIYDFIVETNIIDLDYKIAFQLYAAIMTDTGSFRFERTSPKIHKIAADLLMLGVNPIEVYDKVYEQFRISRVKLLGDALNSIKLDSTKKIAFMILTQETQQKNNAVEADVDGFVNYCLSIEKVQIGILFYEMKDGWKISFRSKGKIPVHKLAAEFGGGGHTNASGTRFYNVKMNDIKDKVILAAQKYLN